MFTILKKLTIFWQATILLFRIFKMNKKENTMKTIVVTQQEITMATRPNVYRNKKKYTRKQKHKGHRD